MVRTEQPVIDREEPLRLRRQGTETDWGHTAWSAGSARAAAERAARESLRAQVAKLERELAGIVARGFPHISTAPAAIGAGHPRLLSLAELERLRDRLAVRVRQAQDQALRRSELEWRSRDLLERMRLEPGRYKFMRLPVTDLGEGGCGAWEVRPRHGLIGMLAGWWELTLSSGCPLPWPRASGARLLPPEPGSAVSLAPEKSPGRSSSPRSSSPGPGSADQCVWSARAASARDRAPLRGGFVLGPLHSRGRPGRSPAERHRRLLAARSGECAALAVG